MVRSAVYHEDELGEPTQFRRHIWPGPGHRRPLVWSPGRTAATLTVAAALGSGVAALAVGHSGVRPGALLPQVPPAVLMPEPVSSDPDRPPPSWVPPSPDGQVGSRPPAALSTDPSQPPAFVPAGGTWVPMLAPAPSPAGGVGALAMAPAARPVPSATSASASPSPTPAPSTGPPSPSASPSVRPSPDPDPDPSCSHRYRRHTKGRHL